MTFNSGRIKSRSKNDSVSCVWRSQCFCVQHSHLSSFVLACDEFYAFDFQHPFQLFVRPHVKMAEHAAPMKFAAAKPVLSEHTAKLLLVRTKLISYLPNIHFHICCVDCLNSFQGGSWVLVRRVQQGTTWHPATFDSTFD